MVIQIVCLTQRAEEHVFDKKIEAAHEFWSFFTEAASPGQFFWRGILDSVLPLERRLDVCQVLSYACFRVVRQGLTSSCRRALLASIREPRDSRNQIFVAVSTVTQSHEIPDRQLSGVQCGEDDADAGLSCNGAQMHDGCNKLSMLSTCSSSPFGTSFGVHRGTHNSFSSLNGTAQIDG